jgi:hypothetical protein
VTGATSHGPYSGAPTTTGAVKASTTLAQMIAPLPPNPTATYYNVDGTLQNPAPAPYTPNGMLDLVIDDNKANMQRWSWYQWH